MLGLTTAALGLNLGAPPAAVTTRASASMNLGRPIRVAVVGGGPAGACAAEIFAQVCIGRVGRPIRPRAAAELPRTGPWCPRWPASQSSAHAQAGYGDLQPAH